LPWIEVIPPKDLLRQRRVEVVRNRKRPGAQAEWSRTGLGGGGRPKLGDWTAVAYHDEVFPNLNAVQQGVCILLERLQADGTHGGIVAGPGAEILGSERLQKAVRARSHPRLPLRGILCVMSLKMRSIKRTPLGRYSRTKVREVVTAVHVLETPAGNWEVRTLGSNGQTRRFDAKAPALEHALKLKDDARIVLHQREPKKVSLVRPTKVGGRVTFRETKFR